MRAPNSPTVAANRSYVRSRAWDSVTSGLGYHLDNFGRWLVARVPELAKIYAAVLAPGVPVLRPHPGWRFAGEYYDQRLWMACRRGALWDAAKKRDPGMLLLLAWYDGTIVEVTLGNDNSLCLYVCGSFEPNEFSFLDGFLKPGMVFVDVGANDGYYTLFAARRVGASGMVVAIEPSTRERINLRRNLQRNRLDNVHVVAAALGATAGDADLRLAQGAHSGHNTLGEFAHDDVKAVRLERVTVDTLDKVASGLNLDRIDFVKIDVEGAEASVISGASAVLEKMRPVMLLEINDGSLGASGMGAESLLQVLRGGYGYEILVFSAATGLVEPFVEGGVLSANIVAVPKERLSELLGSA
jgi:FkbM family methyltransferase